MNENGRFITLKDGRRIFIDLNKYMNYKIKNNNIKIKQKRYEIPKELLEKTYQNHRNEHNDKFADIYVADITPDQFINLTTDPTTLSMVNDEINMWYDPLNLDKINKSYMFLEIDMESGEVSNHEGRHRMMLLKNAGYTKAQIIVYPKTGTADRYNPKTYENMQLKNQVGENYNTYIDQIVPLNKENYEKIKKGRKQ